MHTFTKLRRTFAIVIAGCLLPLGCGSGGGGTAPQITGAPLLVTAGLRTLETAAQPAPLSSAETERLAGETADVVYEFTTPAGESFRFEVATRGANDETPGCRVSFGHLADGGQVPAGGAETLREAGIIPIGTFLQPRAAWLDLDGEGLARATLQGSIERDQTLLVESRNALGRSIALIRLRIGGTSQINDATQDGETPELYDGITADRTVHSSDAYGYGFPVLAQSGDRTSIVVYDNEENPAAESFFDFKRFERRLQYDRANDTVTGAEPVEVAGDAGVFRDHEAAALFNVLVVARATNGGARLEFSFDRGATFAQTETVGGTDGLFKLPIVQVDIAADYSLALAFWRVQREGKSELLLVEGTPSATDENGAPTAYELNAPVVLHEVEGDVMPTIMGVRGNDVGDLVVGYGYTAFNFNEEENEFSARTIFRCATRQGTSAFNDVLVDEDEMTAFDPNVFIVGTGAAMEIYYAYESPAGVKLAVSTDGGATFVDRFTADARGAHMPQVFVRPSDGVTVVDLLYLSPSARGLELVLTRWDDFANGDPVTSNLTLASVEEEEVGEEPQEREGNALFVGRIRINQVGDHGYDATLDGDKIVVVVHEHMFDSGEFFDGPFLPLGDIEFPDDLDFPFDIRNLPNDPIFGIAQAATPPPPAPGLTDPVAAPNAEHMHQLRVLCLR